MDKVIHTAEGNLELECPWYLRVGEQRKVISRARSGTVINDGQIVEITKRCVDTNEKNRQKHNMKQMPRLIILVRAIGESGEKHIFEDSLGPL